MPHPLGEKERRVPAWKSMEKPPLPRDASRQGKKHEYRDKLHLFGSTSTAAKARVILDPNFRRKLSTKR